MPVFHSNVALILFVVLASGCESLPSGAFPDLTFGSGDDQREQEEAHRKRYQETRDPEARDWLFANVVTSGMTRSEITKIFGEDGRRVYNADRFRNNGGHYQMDDEVWKWGPDRNGHSVMLVFRDGKLANFDQREFR